VAQSNFQDVVVLNSNSITAGVEALIIGTDAGSKSLVFAQDPAQASALNLVASNPTGALTQILQNANGTIGLISAISAGGAAFTNGQLVLSNSNGVTFGINGATLTASIAAGAAAVSGIGVSNLGNTLGNTQTQNGTIVLAGIGNITLSQVTAANAATITISGSQSTAPGGIAVAGSTITAGTVDFSNANGVTFGMNGNTITMSALGNATYSAFSQWAEWNTNFPISPASFSVQKVNIPMNNLGTRAQILMAMSGHTNSTGALTISMGIYTMSASIASLASSATAQVSWTTGASNTTTASSAYGGVSGTRYFTVPLNVSMTPGDYMFGIVLSTTNDGTWKIFGRNGVNIVGSYEGDTDYWIDGTSISSVTGLLASFARTNTNYARTGLGALQQPGFILIGTGG
jgi:hypothetical protein